MLSKCSTSRILSHKRMKAFTKLFVVVDDGTSFSILRGRTKRHRVVLRLEIGGASRNTYIGMFLSQTLANVTIARRIIKFVKSLNIINKFPVSSAKTSSSI